MKKKLIIFDMDNTVLRSRIDFPRMKQVVMELLEERGLGRYQRPTVAYTLLAWEDSPDYDPLLEQLLWQRVCQVEEEGMAQAVLEPGAVEALAYLGQSCQLAVLTNNTEQNLRFHLGRLGLLPYLSCVAGRGNVGRLKPAPDGLLWVKSHYPDISLSHTVTIGDASNDAHAAANAGMTFVAYNNSRQEDWDASPFRPVLRLTHWDQAACDAILALGDD